MGSKPFLFESCQESKQRVLGFQMCSVKRRKKYLVSRFNRNECLHKIVSVDKSGCRTTISKQGNRGFADGEPSRFSQNHTHRKKDLFCILWNFKGVIYYELLKMSATVTAERQLNQLSYEIERPFTGRRIRQMILLHDNAKPHHKIYK